MKSVWCWVLCCWHRDGGNDDGSLTWKSSSQGGWWWCSVASTQVFRNTRVTISQNIHCDLQMLRHCRFIDRFHLGGRSQFYFSVRGTWDRMPAVKIRYLLLKSFHSFLPWCLSDMLSWYLSSILGDFSCNSDWNYQQLETETSSLPTVREHRLLTQFGICSLKIHFGSNKRIHAEC